MPSYRIEVSSTNRAGCQDAVCKDQGVKILKGELRLGSWVEMPDGGHGSWKWRHWGCVSGLVIQNLREAIGDGDDEYDWDAIDGYDELNDHPDIQKKIRRVISQGHIDPEDFNGDPDHNVLGSRGIRGRKKKAAEKDEEEDVDTKPAKGSSAKKSTGTKRGRKQDDEELEPPKKKTASGKKAVPAEKAAPAAKGKKAVKQEESSDEEIVKPSRARGKKSAKEAASATKKQQDVGRARGDGRKAAAVKGKEKDGPVTAARKRGRKV